MSSTGLIRRAIPSDAARISALTQSIQALHAHAMPNVFKSADADTFSTDTVRQLLAQPESLFLVAVELDSVVGHLYAEVQHLPESAIRYATSRILVHQLVVDAPCQRRGIGRQLLHHIRQIAEAQQIPTLVIDVWDFNEPAHAFYRANGYRDTRHALSLSLEANAPSAQNQRNERGGSVA